MCANPRQAQVLIWQYCFPYVCSVHGDSTVRSYVDCRWLRTDVLRRNSLDTPKDADLIIGYLFSVSVVYLIWYICGRKISPFSYPLLSGIISCTLCRVSLARTPDGTLCSQTRQNWRVGYYRVVDFRNHHARMEFLAHDWCVYLLREWSSGCAKDACVYFHFTYMRLSSACCESPFSGMYVSWMTAFFGVVESLLFGWSRSRLWFEWLRLAYIALF